jgi:hypothetical protein
MTQTPSRALTAAALLIPLLLMGAGASAQSVGQVLDRVPDQIPSGSVPPRDLNALGSLMADRIGEMVSEESESLSEASAAGTPLDLFTGGADEDPNLAEIRRIARELETQQSVILKLADLQADLIDFGTRDPHAAHRSRVPVAVCEMAIDAVFCRNLSASFR